MRLNLARGLIGIVILWNFQAALVFLIWPGRYTSGFELGSVVGETMLRGFGVLFVMWNVPYAVAMWHPVRHRVSLYEALTMQTIALIGETAIYFSLAEGHELLRAAITRFIVFDTVELAILIGAVLLTRKN